jgi:hypothetical protein
MHEPASMLQYRVLGCGLHAYAPAHAHMPHSMILISAEDPWQAAIRQFKVVAPAIPEDQARESLEAVLVSDATLKSNIAA